MVPSGPNRAAQLAKGVGAGFGAQQNQTQQQDLLKRKQAQEEHDTQEKAKMDNAVRAMHLASTYSLWAKAMQEQADHDPERQKNMDVVSAARDYISRNPATEMSVDIVSPEQFKALHDEKVAALKNDPTHKTKLSIGLPLGMAPAKTRTGTHCLSKTVDRNRLDKSLSSGAATKFLCRKALLMTRRNTDRSQVLQVPTVSPQEKRLRLRSS